MKHKVGTILMQKFGFMDCEVIEICDRPAGCRTHYENTSCDDYLHVKLLFPYCGDAICHVVDNHLEPVDLGYLAKLRLNNFIDAESYNEILKRV